MSTHDTPEAVEAMADVFDNVRLQGLEDLCLDAAAMLRRLHKRTVNAERERDELQGLLVTHEICADRIKATARADALREAIKACCSVNTQNMREEDGANAALERAEAAILALINKEPRHD